MKATPETKPVVVKTAAPASNIQPAAATTEPVDVANRSGIMGRSHHLKHFAFIKPHKVTKKALGHKIKKAEAKSKTIAQLKHKAELAKLNAKKAAAAVAKAEK